MEAQNSTDSNKLGYHLGNRMVFYLARMISAEKETEFYHSDYDKIKKAISIWICMYDEVDDGAIEELTLTPGSVFGKSTEILDTDLMQGIVICIRGKENVAESKNSLISMLEDLFRNDSLEVKKSNLVNKHQMIMTTELEEEMNCMCNFSEVVFERGIEKGIERGKISIVFEMVRDGDITSQRGAQKLSMTDEEFSLKFNEYIKK